MSENQQTESDTGPIRAKANFAEAHAPRSSVTLMRKAVKKPTPRLKSHIRLAGDLSQTKKALNDVSNSRLAQSSSIAHETLARKSPFISHFFKANLDSKAHRFTAQPLLVKHQVQR
jgi:hypothetical protein